MYSSLARAEIAREIDDLKDRSDIVSFTGLRVENFVFESGGESGQSRVRFAIKILYIHGTYILSITVRTHRYRLWG